MGGICGQIGLEPRAFDEAILEGMIQRLRHRGNEIKRLRWRDTWFAVVGDGTPAIWPLPGHETPAEPGAILDGRIDNAPELAVGMAGQGRQAGANSAHLLSAGFREEGAAFLRRLQGLYAAAVHDPASGTTWLARDPVGMRPLYLHRTRSRILFASEIRALLADPTVRLELDPAQLRVLLSLGFNPAPHTLLKGIHKMPPGHYLVVAREGVKVLPFEDPAEAKDLDLSFGDAVEAYRGLLQRVVRRSGEGKTGILLSGGIDSAALVLLRTRDGKEATTFTVGFNDLPEEEDERSTAWQAARALGSIHRERMMQTSEISSLLGSVARILEEPVVASWTPPLLRLLESATGQVPVVWSGQGTGALHGEDPLWRWMQWNEWVAGLPPFLGRIAGGVGRGLGRLRSDSGRSHAIAAREERDRIYDAFALFPDRTLDLLLRAGHMGDRETVRKLLDRWREPVVDRDPLAQALYIRARTYLPDAVFLPAERIASECGLFLRFPYADPEVVGWLERLPASYRLEGGRGKRLHREALSQWIPAEVFARSKRELGDVVRRWLRGEGRERAADWLLGSAAWLPSVLDGVRVRGLIEDAANDRVPADRLILLLHLEHWARETFLGGSR
jgi:asparagine synthase (glutamine-hydrolysing)